MYIDNIRVFLRPILKGRLLEDRKWARKPDRNDGRNAIVRTVEEIGKSMNNVWDFLNLTMDSELDSNDEMLPTLYFAIKYREPPLVASYSKGLCREPTVVVVATYIPLRIGSSQTIDLFQEKGKVDICRCRFEKSQRFSFV